MKCPDCGNESLMVYVSADIELEEESEGMWKSSRASFHRKAQIFCRNCAYLGEFSVDIPKDMWIDLPVTVRQEEDIEHVQRSEKRGGA